MEFLAWGDTEQEACEEFDSHDVDEWQVEACEVGLAKPPKHLLGDEPAGDPGDEEAEGLTLLRVLALLAERRAAEPVVDTQTLPLLFREVELKDGEDAG